MGGCLRATRALICLLACASSSACLRKTEYKCIVDGDCTGGGSCEDTSFCSFADTDCASGRRYGNFADSLSNQCVTATTDAGVADGSGSGSGACPSTYAPISGGDTHVYRKISTASAWTAQRDACASDGPNAYLAIPNAEPELLGARP